MTTTYDPPPKGLVEDSIRAINDEDHIGHMLKLKVAANNAHSAVPYADADTLRAILADLERGDIHLDLSLQHRFSPEMTCYRCRRLLGRDAVVGFPGGHRERFCSHVCRLQVTARGVS